MAFVHYPSLVPTYGSTTGVTAGHSRPRQRRTCTAPSARVSGVSRSHRVRRPRTAAVSPPSAPPSPPVPAVVPTERYAVRDAQRGELYTVADVRCEAFYLHPTDPYFYPMRRREIYTALVERVAAGSRCLVVVDTQVPSEWGPFCSKDGSMVVASLDLTLHHAQSGKRTFFNGDDRNARGEMRFYVSSMAVRVDWRRRGLARMLLRAVDDIARSLGIEEVFLHVDWENDAAVQLYLSEAFERVEKQRKRIPEWLGFLAKREHTLLRKRLTGDVE